MTRSLQIGGGTSSAAAKRELRGAFGDHDDDDDNNSVGESTDDDDDDNLEDPDENIDDEVCLQPKWLTGTTYNIIMNLAGGFKRLETGSGWFCC